MSKSVVTRIAIAVVLVLGIVGYNLFFVDRASGGQV